MPDREHDVGILGATWIADEIARAEARDAKARSREIARAEAEDAEALAPVERSVERVSCGAALLVWTVLGVVAWGVVIGLGIGLVLIVRAALGWL